MKGKLSLLLAVILLVSMAVCLVACNTQAPQTISVDPNQTNNATNTVSKDYAWSRIYDGIKAVGIEDTTFINFDTAFYYTFQRDGQGAIYYLRAKGSIDIYDDTKSKLAIEIGKKMDDTEELLFGMYYTYSDTLQSGLLYVDLSAVAGGTKILKVTDTDLSRFALLLNTALSNLNLTGTLDSLLNTQLLGNSVVTWISNVLFGECQIFDNGNGKQTVCVKLDITDILDIALGAASGFLSKYQDVLEVVRDTIGLDLTDLKALIPAATGSFSVVLQNNVFQSMDFGLDVYYPDIENPDEVVTIDLGVDKLEIGTIPDVQFPEIPEEDLTPFSFTTLSLDVQAYLTTADTSITISGVQDAFGTLLTSLLASVANTELATKPITFEATTYNIELKLRAQLDLTNNDNTNILCELYGVSSSMRLGIYYIGADDALYIDLSGVLGEGARYKVEDLDVVDLIWDTINGLVDKIGSEASTSAQLTDAQKVAAFLDANVETDMEGFGSYVENLITSGEIPQYVYFDENSEAATAAVDYASLITAVLSNIKITKGEGLFSIDRLTMTITKEVLAQIIGMFSTGAELPIEEINLDYESDGFLLGKSVTLDVIFDGILQGFSAHVTANITYGSIPDADSMNSTLNGVRQVKNTFLPISKDGGLNIDTIYASLDGQLNFYTLNGDLTTIQYEDTDSATTMLLQMLLKMSNTNHVNLRFSVAANLNLKSVWDSQVKFVVTDDAGEVYLEIYFSNKTLYLDASYFGLQKFKVDLSSFLTDTDESASTADEAAAEAGGGIDVMSILAAVIGNVNIGTDYIEVLLADRIMTHVLSLIDSTFMDKLEIGGEEDFDGGIRVSFGDGLNLNDMSVYIFASSGSNFDMGLSLSNLHIAMKGDEIVPPAYVPIKDISEFTGTPYYYNAETGLYEAGYGNYQENTYADFINDPNVWFKVGGEMNLHIVPGQIDLSSGLEQILATIGLTSDVGIGSITMEEQISETFNLKLEANLDLEPLIQKLQKKEYTTIGNETQFLLEITREVEGAADETILGIYYRGGILYLDMALLGIDKVAIEFDMFDLIMGLFDTALPAEESPEASGTDFEFSTTYQNAVTGATENYDFALLLALAMSDENVILSVADGLTQLVLNKIGFGFPEIVAELELRWRDSEEQDVEGNPIYEAGLNLYGAILDDQGDEKISLRINVDQPEIAFENTNISKTTFGPEYTLIQLYDEEGNIGIPGVYFETTGYVKATAYGNDVGVNDWEVGNWLESILNSENAGLDNLLKQLLFEFDIHTEIETTLGFKVALMLRLDNKEANINDPDFSLTKLLNFDYILTHSDLAVEIWDGIVGSEVSKKVISLYLLYQGENAFGVPYSTLYLDVDTSLVNDVHIKLDGFSLASLLGMLEEDYAQTFDLSTADTTAQWTPFDSVTEVSPTFVSSDPTVATVGAYSAEGVLTLNLLGKAGEAVITATRGEQIVKAKITVTAPVVEDPAGETDTPAVSSDTLSAIAAIISGGISSITINDDELMVNLGAKLIGVVLGLFLPDIYVKDPVTGEVTMAEMVELNPERSFISLNWTTKELVASLGVDPLAAAIGIDGVGISLYEREVADVNPSNYISLTELSQFSLSVSADLSFLLKETVDSAIQIDDYLKAFIADIALDFGLEIDDEIYAGLSLEVEANLNLNNVAGTELFMQLVNNNTGKILFGLYLVGDKLYINMGMLSEQNVVLENISIAQIVSDALNGLVDKVTTSVTEAAGTEDVPSDDQARALEVIFAFAKNEISLTFTQNLIIAVINYIVNNNKAVEDQIDLNSIFYGDNAIADLGMSLKAVLNTQLPSLTLTFDSSLFTMSASIVEPYFTTSLNPDRYTVNENYVTGSAWNGLYVVYGGDYVEITTGNRYVKTDEVYTADPEGNYVLVSSDPVAYITLESGTVKYSKRITTSARIQDAIQNITFNSLNQQPKLSFNVDLFLNYSLDATYALLSEEEADKLPAEERYTKRASDGYFVQDDNGLYQKLPTEFQSLLDAVLGLDLMTDLKNTVLKSGGGTNADVTIGDLLSKLALEIYIDDPIANQIKVSLFGNVNLEYLGIMGVLSGEKKLTDLDFSLPTLLSALELGLKFTVGSGADEKTIQLSFVDQLLYVDLTGIDGPRIKIDILSYFASNDTGEAASTEGETTDTTTASTLSKVLNAIIKVAVIKARTVVGGLYNELDSFNIYFNSDLLPALISVFSEGSMFDMSRYALDENESGLFLKMDDAEFDGSPSLSLVMRTIDGMEVKLSMATGLSVDIGATKTVLTESEKKQYADLTDFKSQTYNFSVIGSLYFGADAAETYNLSGLFAAWFGDMLFELRSAGEFEDAATFRLSANVNLADIYLEYFTVKNEYALIAEGENYTGDKYTFNAEKNEYTLDANGTYKLVSVKPTFEQFVANSNLDTLEIAFELLKIDSKNNIVYDESGDPEVLGGIYLYGGAIYLDGSRLFENAPVSYIPNVFEIIESLMKTTDEIADNINGQEAVSTADDVEIDQGNDAVLALIFSDPSIQLSLTKSFISIMLGLLMPDLGSIDDIFDKLSLDFSFIKGLVSYEPVDLGKVWAGDRFTHYYEDASGAYGYVNGEFVTIDPLTYEGTRYAYNADVFYPNDIGEYRISSGESFVKLDFDEVYTGTQYNYEYYQNDTGAYLYVGGVYYNLAENAGNRYDDDQGAVQNDSGAYLKVGEIYVYIQAASRFDIGFIAVPEGQEGTYKQGEYGDYIQLHKGVDGKESEWTGDRYAYGYYLNANGGYVIIGEVYYEIPANKYILDGENYVLDENGTYVFITATQTFVELTAANRYAFGYYLAANGEYKRGEAEYTLILPYNERYKQVKTYSVSPNGEYKYVEGVYTLIASGETYEGTRYTEYVNYIRSGENVYNADYGFMRISNRFHSIGDFGLSLSLKVGTFNAGLVINGLNIGFGQTAQFIPQEVIDEAHPFYESTVSISTVVDLKLSLTAGTIDMGELFYALLGDIDGLVIEVPEYGLGETAMHLRAKVDLKLDLATLANSELSLEIYSVTAVGYEDLWFGLYYQGDVLYIDASKLNLPKISISDGSFAEKLEEMLGKYLGRDIYTEEELEASGTEDEAISAGDELDYSLAAALLIGSHNLTLTIGEDLVFYVLKLIKLGETPIYDLIYNGVEASGNIDFDINPLDLEATDFCFTLGIKLAAGDDYIPMTADELAATDPASANYVAPTLRYKFVADTSGLFKYDTEKAAYVKMTSTQLIDASLRYSPKLYGTDEDDMVLANYTYKLVEGDPANYDNYEKELRLMLQLHRFDISFNLEHEFALTNEDIATFTEYKEIEHIAISERINLTTMFEESSLDLTEWVKLFFPDEDISALQGLINVDANGDGDFTDEGEVLRRDIYLDISIDVKFASIVNLLRRYAAESTEAGRQLMQWIEGDIDIATLISLFSNSQFDFLELLSYINASVVISTETPENGVETLMGFYIQGGYYQRVANYVVAEESYVGQRYSYDPNEKTGYVEDDEGIYKSVLDTARLNSLAPTDRYSHYFANPQGAYVYVDGQYILADESVSGTRYSYDNINFYQNEHGEYERIAGGTYIDLTHYGIPYIYVGSYMMREVFSNLTASSASDEVAATDEPETPVETPDDTSDETAPITFPLLDSSTTDIIKMFVWGMQVSSSYVSLVLQASYLNSIAQLVTDEDDKFSFYFDFNNRSTIKINTDRTRYRYETISDPAVLSDSNVIKYLVTENIEGSYVVYNGYAVLKGSLTDEQLADITGLPFDVVAVTQEYVNANAGLSYSKLIVETDEDIAFIDALFYLFNHKLELQLGFLDLGIYNYNYTTDGAAGVPASSRYSRTPYYGDDDGTMSVENGEYYLLVGSNYYPISDELRFEDELGATQSATGDYLKTGDSTYVSISANSVKRLLTYYYSHDDNGAYIRQTVNLKEMVNPMFEENAAGTYMYDATAEKYVAITDELYEGTRYSQIDYLNIEDLSKVSITLEGSFNIDGSYSETPLSDVLYGLVGDLSSLLTVGLDGNPYSLEIGFAAAVNLDFDLDFTKIGTGAPMSEVFSIKDFDVAIDVWRVEEDESITNIVGVYYHDGYVYVDLSFVLNDGGMLKIDMGENAVENLINSLFDNSDESEAQSSEVLQGGNRTLAGFYLDIYRNNIVINMSTALIKLIVEKLAGEGVVDAIYAKLPNIMPYLSLKVDPLSIAAGTKLFNETGTSELLDINFTLYGFDSRSNLFLGNASDALPDIFTAKNADNDLNDVAVTSLYNRVASVNLDALLGKDETAEPFTLEIDTIKFQASLEIQASILAGIVNWSDEFQDMLGEEVSAVLKALAADGINGMDANSYLDATLTAFVNVNNFLDDSKSTLEKLAGTQIRLSMLVNSTLLPWANDPYAPQDITVVIDILFNADGTMSLYLDLADLGTKLGLGTAFSKIKFENIDLSGMFASNDAEALSSEDIVYGEIDEETETGVMPLEFYNVFNSIVKEIQICTHKIAINLRSNMADSLLSMLTENETLKSMVKMPQFDKTEIALNLEDGFDLGFDFSVAVADGAEYVLIADYYPDWAGTKYAYDAETQIYTESVDGTYMKPSDINLTVNLGDIGLQFNLPSSGITVVPEDYVDLDKIKINLAVEGSVGLYAANYTQENMQNVIDLSGIFEILFSGGSLANTDLDLRINDTIDVVYDYGMYMYLDLEDLSTAELSFTVKNHDTGDIVIAAYMSPKFVEGVYTGHTIYVDLNIILGEDGKLSINNFDLKSILEGMLGGVLSAGTEASTTSLSSAANIVNALIPAVFIAMKPEYLALAINAKAINAIINFYQRAENKTEKDVFPEIGDILLEMYTAADDKMDISLGIKVNDSFYGSVDLTELTLSNTAATGLNGKTGHLPTEAELANFTAAYDIKTGEILLESIGLSFDGSLAITSEGYKVGDANYEKSFNHWLGAMVDYLLETALGTSASLSDADDFEFVLANGDISFDMKVKADLNLKALISDTGINIGGLMYSDFAIELYFGAPINTLALGIYYLGSSSVTGSSFNYNVGTYSYGSFADYIYLDLTALGLGKVKLSGIAGLLGATGITAATPASDASSAEELDVRTVESITAEVILEENKIAVNFNSAIITRLLGLLGLELEFGDPTIENMQVDIEFDNGLNSIVLNSSLDSVGTALYMSLNNPEISLNSGNNKLIDVADIVNSTKYNYTGLSLGTIGVGGLLNNVLESLDPSTKITLVKLTKDSYCLTDHNSWSTKASVNSGYNGASKLTINLTRGPYSIVNETSNSTDPQRLILSISATHPMRADDTFAGTGDYSLTGYLFNGDVVLTGLADVLSGLDLLVSFFEPLDLGGMLSTDGSGQLLNFNKMAKGNNDYYNYPTAGDAGGTYSKNDIPDPTKLYKWAPDLENIIQGLSISLWNGYNYAPYKDGSSTYSPSSVTQRYSTLKLTLNKDCYNDLVCYVYYMLISSLGDKLASALHSVAGGSYSTTEGMLRAFEACTTPAARKSFMTSYANAMGVSVIRSLISSYDGWISGLGWLLGAGSKIAGLSLVFDSLLPLPWATVNPTVCIYLDSMASGAAGDVSAVPGVQSMEIYVNATATTILNTNQYLRMILQPRNSTEEMISFVEVESASAASGEVTPPTSITITDPAQRKGTMTGGTAGTKSLYLTAEYLNDEDLFPQRANVTFLDGTTDNKGSGGLDDLGGAHINWDATSVNLTAASAATQWLAGYVYGYVLGKLIYRVPVYVTNAYEVTAIKGYYKALDGTWATKALTVDMNTSNATFNLELPDEVRITFRSGGTKTFTTHFADEDYLTSYLVDKWGYIAPATEGADSNATAQYPAGLLTWNYKDFEYDLVGGSVKVYYTYSWGLANTATNYVIIPIKNYKIANLTKFNYGATMLSNFTGFNAFNLGDYMSGTAASDFDLAAYIANFTTVNGKYVNYTLNGVDMLGTSFSNLDVKWDLTNLTKAMSAIYNETTEGWDYYKGIDTEVTAYVGGMTFAANSYYGNYPESTDGSTFYDEAKGYIYVSQPIKVKVKVAPREFDKFVKSEIKFDPYAYDSFTDAGAIDSELQVYFDIDGVSTKKWLTDGVDMEMTLPEVDYSLISYKGYAGSDDLNINVKIGTLSSGYQTATLPIVVRTMTASTKTLTVTDTFNPEWYNAFETVDMSFADSITHTMYIDWSTLKLYSRATTTSTYELTGADKNIYSGGTKYATAQAYVLDGENNELGLFNGKRQTVKFMLNIRTKTVTGISLYDGDGDLNDISNYTVSSYTINPLTYDADSSNYFTAVGYGNANAFVKISYMLNGSEQQELAYVLNWDKLNFSPSYSDASTYAIATIGSQKINVNVNVQTKVVSSFTTNGSYVYNADDKIYEYSPLVAFGISNVAENVYFADGTSTANVPIEWDSTVAPTAAELNAGTFTRNVVLFPDSSIMRQEVAITVRVLYYADITVHTPVIEGEIKPYYLFGEFALPDSVTFYDQLGTEYNNVPIIWNSYELPTDAEILAGSFTRYGVILSTDKYQPLAQTFTIYNNYTVKEFAVVDNKASYTLKSADFYKGLPATLTVVNSNGVEVIVNAEWLDVNYDISGLAETAVRVRLSGNGFETEEFAEGAQRTAVSDMVVNLTVESAEIREFVAASTFVYDPFGIYSEADKLFASGTEVAVKVGGVYVNNVLTDYNTYNVKATYQLPADMLDSAKYYGKTLDVQVSFDYVTGVVTKTMKVAVLDRTVTKVTNPLYRSVVIDPYVSATFSQLPAALNAKTVFGATSFDFDVVWPSDSLITRNGGSYPEYTIKFVYEVSEGVEAAQYVNIPINILSRTVTATNFVVSNGFTQSATDAKKTTTTYAYTNAALSQIMKIVYGNTASAPTTVTYVNPFTYDAGMLPNKVTLTFSDGETRTYNVTWKNLPDAISSVDTIHTDVIANVWSGEGSALPIIEIPIELVVNAFKVTRMNSNIASDTLDTAFRYHFYPYADLNGTQVTYTNIDLTTETRTLLNAFNTANYNTAATLYLDGQWVLIKNLADYAGYTRLTEEGATVKYAFDTSLRAYVKSASGEYAFVYSISQNMDIAWDVSDLTYTYEGGVRYISAKLGPVGLEQTVRVPITLEAQNLMQITYDTTYFNAEATDTTKAYFLENKLFDPWETDYSYTGADKAKFFPEFGLAKFTSDEGATSWTQLVDITWNLASVNPSYEGGVFAAKATINGSGEYNNLTCTAKTQTYIKSLTYVDRTAKVTEDTTDVDNLAIMAMPGYVSNVTNTSTTWIDPYDYSTPDMPDWLLVTVNDENGVSSTRYFWTKSTVSILSWDLNSFRPNYTGGETVVYAKLTVGDAVQYLPIKMNVKRKYISLVKGVVNGTTASSSAVNTGTTGNYYGAFNTTSGLGSVTDTNLYTYYMSPFVISTYKLPTSYNVTFNTWTYDSVNGFQAVADETKVFSYAIVTMPAAFEYGWSEVTQANAYNATIKFGSQQYVTVPVAVYSASIASITTPTYTSTSVMTQSSSSVTINGTTTTINVPIVWYGVALVYNKAKTSIIATHKVSFSATTANCYLPECNGRQVVYLLRAVAGVMIDKNGNVLTTTTASSAVTASYNSVTYTQAAAGDTIPLGAYGSGYTATITSTR